MEYKTKTINMNQMLVGGAGFIESLCNTCHTVDCTNPVEIRKISKIGVVKEMKVLIRGRDPHFVVDCQGYTNA